jgi:glutamate-1-semialdehyde 2,1-aminomutase
MLAKIADLRDIDPQRMSALAAEENARFVAERPRSMELLERGRRSMPRGVPMAWMDDLYEHPPVWVNGGDGAYFTDVDGHRYLDMYVADMSAFCGHAPAPVTEAVCARMAEGIQFLLPGEDAIAVAEHLATRYGQPKWQFTVSATQANIEVIRLARVVTGREVVVVFDGKYHGELDTTLVVLEDGEVVPESQGLPMSVSGQTRVVPFNDAQALERALAPGDVALVLTEPALTNAGFLLPREGFHGAVRELTRDAGTLLAIDETHTLVTSYAGLARAWDLESDFLTVGKSIAAGVPFAAYGMSEEVGSAIAPPERARVVMGVVIEEVATGGTLFGNALTMAAARSALTEVLTPEAFDHAAALGERMAAGLRNAIDRHGVAWSVSHAGSHAFYFFESDPPADAAASREADDPDLRALVRVYMANRGVWESGWWLGPTVSVAHTEADVDTYLERFDSLLAELTA